MTNPLEFLDRTSIASDCRGNIPPAQLRETEIDQGASDLLDAADPFGKLQPAPKLPRRFFEFLEARVGVTRDAQRGRKSLEIADLLEYSLRRFPMLDSLRNRSGHVFRPGKLQENLTDSPVAALPGLVEC